MTGRENDALLRRRRVWGVPPDAVRQMVADYERAQADLRARMRELEVRLAHMITERDEANRSVAALQEQVGRLERENAEIANRPETVREEALRFVIDVWAEAQTIREQTKQEIEKAEAAARAEVAAMRQALSVERERHETEMREARERHEVEIAMLRERRLKAIADLESLAESLLSHAARGAAPEPAAPAPSPAPVEAVPTPQPAAGAPPRTDGGGSEDRLLAKALDDLEAILSASRASNGPG